MDLGDIRKALLDPEIYPERVERIETAETHVSLVFLTGKHAYKIKKAVDFGFLDYTTLEKRKHFCHKEIALNRRLSPHIYLGVVEIKNKDGNIFLNGEGEIVEYAVKMVQIPEDRMMDRCLAQGKVGPSVVERVAERLVAFYGSSETNEQISDFARPERIRQDTVENFDQTEKYIGITLTKETFEEIRKETDSFYREKEDLFAKRMKERRIRDCHGDLRLEHICLGYEIFIIDCIEFNDRFRYTDVASDIAFLAMDLDYQERPDLSRHLIETYVSLSGDVGLLGMLDFYKAYRAYVRGKVESFRLDDPHISESEKEEARERAKKYFLLSHTYARNFFSKV